LTALERPWPTLENLMHPVGGSAEPEYLVLRRQLSVIATGVVAGTSDPFGGARAIFAAFRNARGFPDPDPEVDYAEFVYIIDDWADLPDRWPEGVSRDEAALQIRGAAAGLLRVLNLGGAA
jgi:hypothetical protein